MFFLGFLALLGASKVVHIAGYRNIQTSRQGYPVMAKYDSTGILRYCDGKRAGKAVGVKAREKMKGRIFPMVTHHYTNEEQKQDLKNWTKGVYFSPPSPVQPSPEILESWKNMPTSGWKK